MYQKHGGRALEIYQKEGKIYLDFSANINPLGLDIRVREKLRNSLDDVIYYPVQDYDLLKQKVTLRYGVNKENICFANGISDGIFYLCLAILQKKYRLQAYGISPGFIEYERCIKSLGGEYYTFDIDYKESLSYLSHFSVDTFLNGMPKDTNIIFLCNPDNPSARLLAKEDIYQVLSAMKERDVHTVVDESFMDFIEKEQSVRSYLKEFKNLIILHSFTKIFAIPGLRFGAIFCADSKLCTSIKELIPPWNINTPALVAVDTYLELADETYYANLFKILDTERIYLQESLRLLGFDVLQSYANFIFFAKQKGDSKDYATLLYAKGILIRVWEEGYYRIAIKNHIENVRLIQVLKEVLKNE